MIYPFVFGKGLETYKILMDLDPKFIADAGLLTYRTTNQLPEPEVCQFMAHVLRLGDFVVDGGANVGFFTLLMASFVGPTGHVVAVEPGQNNLPRLRRNVELNNFKNVEIGDYALGAAPGRAFLNEQLDSGYNSIVGKNDLTWTSEVRVETLERICGAKVDPRLIKLDIEGSEKRALEGLFQLDIVHPDFIVMELNGDALAAAGTSAEWVHDWMADRYGYRMFLLSPLGGIPALVPVASKVFSRRENANVLFTNMQQIHLAWPEIEIV